MPTLTPPKLSLAIVDLRSSLVIAISDISTYYGGILNSNNVSLQITPPGWPTVNVPFTPGQVNVYDCADLQIECGDSDCCELPDGIYNIIYTVRPVVWPATQVLPLITQSFIKVDKILCRYHHAFQKVDMDCECYDEKRERYLKELFKVELYIWSSVAESNKGNYKLSHKYYSKAQTLLDKLECASPKKGCGCS